MDCTNPFRITKNLNPLNYPDGLDVPCGKCQACRIAKRRMWTMRNIHELTSHREAVFLTLTYKDECLPKNNSLEKEALQKFFKRLRTRIERRDIWEQFRDFTDTGNIDRRIRYYACGEYGEDGGLYVDKDDRVYETTERPHYHAIIYGLSLRDYDKDYVIECWPFCDWSVKSIKKNSFGIVEPKSIQYVCQYIDKKLYGELENEEYTETGRQPVFKISSLGIGKLFADKYKQSIAENGYISQSGIKQAIPRYYIERLGIDTTEIKIRAIEKDLRVTERHSGVECSADQAYKHLNLGEYTKYYESLLASRNQHDLNLKGRKQRKRKL